MHHLHPGCLNYLLGQTFFLISENQPVSHKSSGQSFVTPRVPNSCWSNKSSISYLFRSTVVTLNTTPFSHRIMKSLWEKGQFPMLSPSLPACRTEQSINLGRTAPSTHLTNTGTSLVKHTLSTTEIATFMKFLLVMSSS